MQSKANLKRIVVKIGSSLISSNNNTISLKYLNPIIKQVSMLLDDDKEIVLVSSGAIACGMSVLKLKKRPKDIVSLQAMAAIGQNELMGIYRKLLGHKHLCAQLLLTWEDFESRNRYLNVRHTILHLIANKTLSIINENDTVSTDEIRFGDNDKLSTLVASLIDADLLIILSDVDGLYRLPSAEVINVVDEITPEINRLCFTTDKEACVGGMSSKIQAIRSLSASGIPCVIANGKTRNILLRLARGESIGTLFLAKGLNLEARKRWIAYGTRTRGSLLVDDGAKNAVLNLGKSLLSPGIISVKGNFKEGEVISILDKDSVEIARGLVNFSAHELIINKGMRLKKEVIHRDNMVVL